MSPALSGRRAGALVACLALLLCSASVARAYVCEDDMSFGLELEYAGSGDMKVLHINQMPASNYERLMGVIASTFGVTEPKMEHVVDFVPHPTMPEKYEPRRVRTVYWVDPFERRWKITAEYVAKGGVYDGYEVVSPPMRNPDEVEGVVRALVSSGFVEEGLKSGSHVHINASCLIHPDGEARGLVNLFLLYESNDPLIRRIFGTQHLGGSQNVFSQAMYESVPEVVASIAALAPENRTVAGLTEIFDRFRPKEIEHLGLAGRETISLANLKKIWKYHSVNLVNSLPINSVLPAKKRTVEFRAFDLMDPRSHRLAIELVRAMVKKAAALAAAGIDIRLDKPLQRSPMFTESSISLLPADPHEVRAMAHDFIASLGLDTAMFEHRFRLIVEGGNKRIPLDAPVYTPRKGKKGDADEFKSGSVQDLLNDDDDEYESADFAVGTAEAGVDDEALGENILGSTHARRRNAPKAKTKRGAKKEKRDEGDKVASLVGLEDGVAENEDDDTLTFGAWQQQKARVLEQQANEQRMRRMAEAALRLVGSCDPNPCQNGGTCVEEDKDVHCECPDDFGGEFCEIDKRKTCADKPCHAHADCSDVPSGENRYTCTCQTGYEGDGVHTCDEIDGCLTTTCAEFATCNRTGPGTAECNCDEGYEGDAYVAGCTEIDACLANPCLTDATCEKTGPNKFKCHCPADFVGDGITDCQFVPQSDTVNFGPTGSFILHSNHLFDQAANVSLKFRFKSQRSGTLFAGQSGPSSFVFLRLDALGAQLILNLGGGAVLASKAGQFLDGRWHSLEVDIRTPFVTLSVDGLSSTLIAPASSTGLDLPDQFQIGNFGGCITVLGIQGRNLTGGLFRPVKISDYYWGCPLPDIEFTIGLVPTGFFSIPKNRLNQQKDVWVKMDFRTAVRNGDALLFLAGSTTLNTEFRVSASEAGVTLKVNFGSAPRYVFVPGEFADGFWHTFVATINAGKLILTVDDVTRNGVGLYPANVKAMRTNGAMTLGGGFTGCLRNLIINDETISFRETNAAGLGFQYGCPANSDACSLTPCVNAGKCSNTVAGNYSCACVPGVYGTYCQQSRTNTISFTGDGYLSLNGNPFTIIRLNTITFSFKTSSGAGLLFYTGHRGDDQIYMKTTDAGGLVIGYELGSGIGEVAAPGPYNDNRWHYVVVTRVGKKSTIIVDGNLAVVGEIAGWAQALNIDPSASLNIGGLPPGDTSVAVPRFNGCLRELRVDDKMVDFNGVGLVQRNRRFGCASGAIAEVGFANGYMSFAPFNPRGESTISLYFRTSKANGTIVYGGQAPTSTDFDYITLYMRNGQVFFEFFAGYDNVVAFTKQRYDDGAWHQVTATRVGGNSILYVDTERVRAFSADKEGRVKSVDLTGPLFIGRADNGRANWPFFTGCVREVLLSSVGVGTVNLDLHNPLTKSNVLDSCAP